MPAVIATIGTLIIGAAAGVTFTALQVGIAVGLSVVAYLLTPKPPTVGTQRPEIKSTARFPVAPARWIIGRARVGAVLVFYHEAGGTLHIALVLSAGACEGIERVWSNGEEIAITRTARTGSGESGHLIAPETDSRFGGRIAIYEYFAADGNQGDTLRAAAPSDWTTEHELNGLSWAHVVLSQPDYGTEIANRFWARFPDLNFLVKGAEITWPGQATPIWTDNAAALRYWWLTVRRGIPATAIDTAGFTAAYNLCEQTISFSLPAGYEDYANSSKRYAINGVVTSDDDPTRVEAELDFAWQGYAVEADGVFHFRPGADRAIARAIAADDIVRIDGIQPAPAIQDRINAAVMTLAQSREHDWLEASIPEFEDAAAVARDGEVLAEDLGGRAFVADPIAAGRLLAIQLRRARASAVYTYTLKPGAALEWLAILPSDWVTITDPEHGLEQFPAVVAKKTVNDDWSVTLDLSEQPDGVYADTLVLPPLKPRQIDIPGPELVPAVTGLAAASSYVVAQDGTVVWHIDVSWDDALYHTRLRVTDGDDTIAEALRTLVAEAGVDGTSQRFTVDTPGTYTVRAYHVTLAGFASASATATLTFDWTDVPVPAPVIISAEQYGLLLQIVALAVANRDVSGIEVRYTSGAIDGTDALDAINADGWADANRAGASLVAQISTTEPIVADVVIPSTGRYRLFARLFNTVGNFGPVVEIGYKIFEVPAIETLSPQQWPLWLGTLNNLYRWTRDEEYRLLPDYDSPNTLTRDQLNGVEGWPFGPIEGYDATMSDATSTYYETEVIDLGESSNVDVVMDIEPHDPVAGVVTRADIETGRVVVVAGTDIELYDSNGATATGTLKSAAGTLDLTDALTIAEIRYDSTNSKIRFDRETANTDDFDDWADDNQGLSVYVEVGGTVEELAVTDVAASAAAYLEWGISADFKTALDNQTATDRLMLMVAEAGQKPLAIVLPEDGHDFYVYHAAGATQPARSTFTEVAVSGVTRVTGARYLAARVHLKKWKGLALQRFSPQIRRIS